MSVIEHEQITVLAAHEKSMLIKSLTDRFITEATALGMTPREVVRFLARRIKEGD